MNNRVDRFINLMHQNGIHNFIVSNSFNLKYLSHFSGLPGDGCMLISDKKRVLITDSRYELEMKQSLPKDIELAITRDYYGTAVSYLPNDNSLVGFESSLDFLTYQNLNRLLPNRLVAKNGLIEQLRDTKDNNEIDILRDSTLLVSQAYESLLNYVKIGMTERELSLFIYDFMLKHGAQKPSFDTIVASGYRSALPHGDSTNKTIKNGELVTVDFGFYYYDYTSDMTRTFAVGDPGNELRKAYNVVLNAQNKMINSMKNGTNGRFIDATARNYISDKGYGNYFGHGSGHSIGLDIHETPILNPSSKDNVYKNYVMTAEPGIYLPGKGGIRIEDDVLITDGKAEVLTTAPKNLIIL